MDGRGVIVVVSPPTSSNEPLSAMAAGAIERFVRATSEQPGSVRITCVRPSRPASDPTHDAPLVDWAVFLAAASSSGVSGATIDVDLPPPPRVVEALLPEIRAALDDQVRQEEWGGDEGDEEVDR